MLTWALCWFFSHAEEITNAGGILLSAMILDTVIIVSITACWWGKYIE